MAQDTAGKKLTTTVAQPQNLEEHIRYRAYQIYEARGRGDGHALDDWLRAEEEITQQKTRTTTA